MKKIIFIIFAIILFFPSFVFAEVLDEQLLQNSYKYGNPTIQGFILDDGGAGGSWLVENFYIHNRNEASGRFCISDEIDGDNNGADCMVADDGLKYVIQAIPRLSWTKVDIRDITLTTGTYYMEAFYNTFNFYCQLNTNPHPPTYDYWIDGALQQNHDLKFQVNGIYTPPAEDKKPSVPIFLLIDDGFYINNWFIFIFIFSFGFILITCKYA